MDDDNDVDGDDDGATTDLFVPELKCNVVFGFEFWAFLLTLRSAACR